MKRVTEAAKGLDGNQELLQKMRDGGRKLGGATGGKAGEDRKPTRSPIPRPRVSPIPRARPRRRPRTAPKPAEPPPVKPAPKAAPVEEPAVTQRKVIRSGDVEFEVDSFESTVERIRKIVRRGARLRRH